MVKPTSVGRVTARLSPPEVSVRAAPSAAAIAQNASLSLSRGATPIQASPGSSIANRQSQITSLHLPPPALRLGQPPPHQPIKLVQALPPGPALVWDYVIVNVRVMDFVFGPRVGSGGRRPGLRPLGLRNSDVWNKCPTTDNTTYTSLVWSDNTSSATSITIGVAPGNWGLTAETDVMYSGYVYSSGGPFTLTISNLASGTYNFYLYGHGAANDQSGVYGLVSGSLIYGTNSTANDSYSWNSTVWEQGEQYIVISGVAVSSNSPVTITSLVDPGGYSIISGMQIVPSASYCVTAPTGLVSLWQGEGNSWDVWGANSAGEYDFSFQSGQIGEAFFFDGYTTFLNVNASATLNVGANGAGLTLACWLKPGDLNPPSDDRVVQRRHQRDVFLDVQHPLRQFQGHSREQSYRVRPAQPPDHQCL